MNLQESIERTVIGGMMLLETYPPEVMILKPEHFEDPTRGRIWGIISSMLERNEPIDEVSVSLAMTDGGAFNTLSEMVEETPTTCLVGHWADMLAKRGSDRIAKAEIERAISAGGDPVEIASQVEEIARRHRLQTAEGLQHVSAPLRRLLKQLDDEFEGKSGSVVAKTGLRDVDRRLKLERHGLTILAARPGMGKTALAGNVIRACCREDNGAVAMFSLEMDSVAIIRRMLVAEAGVPSEDLPGEKSGKVAEAMSELHKINMHIDDRPALSIPQMKSALSRLGRISLVVVDYLQLAAVNKKLERQDLRIGEIAKDLKGLAKHFDCHVLALSQLNRKVEDRNPPVPHMSDLRDSGKIEEVADSILMIYRPGYYSDNDDDRAMIQIEKNRNGEKASVNVVWDAKHQRFTDRRNP